MNKQNNRRERKLNPSIYPRAHQKYNPKREANAQNREQMTGLDDDFDVDFDEEHGTNDDGLGEERLNSDDEPGESSGAI